MTAGELLRSLTARGVVLSPRRGKLVVDAPAGVLTVQDRALLGRHKAELLAVLGDEPTPGDLPPDWHLLWDERAAIMEYGGGLPRERAEAAALADILRLMRAAAATGGVPAPGSPSGP